jgi:hypothetical protein
MHSQIIETCWISVILVVAILIPAEIANWSIEDRSYLLLLLIKLAPREILFHYSPSKVIERWSTNSINLSTIQFSFCEISSLQLYGFIRLDKKWEDLRRKMIETIMFFFIQINYPCCLLNCCDLAILDTLAKSCM